MREGMEKLSNVAISHAGSVSGRGRFSAGLFSPQDPFAAGPPGPLKGGEGRYAAEKAPFQGVGGLSEHICTAG